MSTPMRPQSVHLWQALTWWLRQSEAGRVPERSYLDAFALRGALPYVWLVAYEAESGIYRHRLAGEHVNDTFGFSLRGRTLADIYPASELENVTAAFEFVRTRPGVVYAEGQVYCQIGKHRYGERLMLPISDTSGAVRFVLGATDYGFGFRRRHPRPVPDEMVEYYLGLAELDHWRGDDGVNG